MITTNLVLANRPLLERKLTNLVEAIKTKNLTTESQNSFLLNYMELFNRFLKRQMPRNFDIGNKPLINALKQIPYLQDLQQGTIIDFCCGDGYETLKLASQFPRFFIYGIDYNPRLIQIAQNRLQKSTLDNVTFEHKDIHKVKKIANADAIVFNNACGRLSDRLIGHGIKNNVSVIAGTFCCYHKFANPLTYLGHFHHLSSESDYFKNQLGINENDLRRISKTYSKEAIEMIFFNRLFKLLENNYGVKFDEKRHLIVAQKKN